MLQSLKEATIDPTSGVIKWVHTAAIVEGVDAVLAVATAAGETGAIATLAEWIEGVGGGAVWPVTVGVASGVAVLAALGLPYAEAAEKIKKWSSTEGLSHGIVLGVMGEMPDFVDSHFFNTASFPTKKYDDPQNNKLAQYYYNGALTLGYHYGDDLSADQAGVFWNDISRPLEVEGETKPWPWRDLLPDEKAVELTRIKFCVEAAGRFVLHHIDLRD